VPDGVLRPGGYYIWSATSFQGGDAGSKCRALVRVLTAEERAVLDQMEQESAAARAAAPDDPAPPLLLAQSYERLGLIDDALTSYRAVLELRPEEEGVQAAVKRLEGGAPGSSPTNGAGGG
jgi:hypothetical protein